MGLFNFFDCIKFITFRASSGNRLCVGQCHAQRIAPLQKYILVAMRATEVDTVFFDGYIIHFGTFGKVLRKHSGTAQILIGADRTPGANSLYDSHTAGAPQNLHSPPMGMKSMVLIGFIILTLL